MNTAAPESPSAADDLRLAQLHLRLGQLTLARAELEDLAGRDPLDVDGLAALAEARWRTGAAAAALDAARAHLSAGGSDVVALCIAAEAAAAAGEQDEARELIRRVGALEPAELDALFAGMPQRAAWPMADAVDDRAAGSVPGSEAAAWAPGRLVDAAREPLAPSAAATARADWDPAAELRRAREELGSRPDRALVRLALVLRVDPTLAKAVLDVVALRREPAAAVVRGDAQRLLGRHLESEAAFDAAAESLEAS